MSIRAIADAVGVTPPSIYLHFPDKDALVLAVCERRLRGASTTRSRPPGAATDDPVESLRRRGRAYVEFGLEHPEQYRVLFMTATAHPPPRRSDSSAARAFQHLVDSVQRAIDAGALRPVDPLVGVDGRSGPRCTA